MRKELAKAYLSQQAYRIRHTLGWSQERMAESLAITPRAYGDLERGKYCFSAWSLLSLLNIMGKDESWKLIGEICSKMEETKGGNSITNLRADHP